jgi:hypothetical protein
VLDDAIAKFALAYAKQTEQDHGALDKAPRRPHQGGGWKRGLTRTAADSPLNRPHGDAARRSTPALQSWRRNAWSDI